MYQDQDKFNKLVLDEIQRHNHAINILVLFHFKSDLLNEILNRTSANITLVSTDLNIDDSNRVDKWSEDPFKFIDLAKETYSRFDLILLINPEEYFNTKNDSNFTFESTHKEMFRDIQRYLLKDSGIIIFLTHQPHFKLDGYIKPGADKLTKQVLTEEERDQSSLQAYAFYK